MVKAVDDLGKGAGHIPYKDKLASDGMPSIIEKETAIPMNAIRLPQYLSTVYALVCACRTRPDPVIYGMGERYNGNFSRADLETPTAYNVLITGLPPGAIATPGADSLKALASGKNAVSLFCGRW